MKIILSILLLASALFSVENKGTVTMKMDAKVRAGYVDKATLLPQSSPILDERVKAGKTYKVLATFGDWYQVRVPARVKFNLIESGKYKASNLDAALEGYVWVGRLNVSKQLIFGSGVNIRKSSEVTDGNLIGSLYPDTKVEVLKCNVTWVKIGEGKWVYVGTTDYYN